MTMTTATRDVIDVEWDLDFEAWYHMLSHPLPVAIGADQLAALDRRTPYQDAVAASARARNAELELARFDPRDTGRAA